VPEAQPPAGSSRSWGWLLPAGVFVVPLVAALLLGLAQAFDAEAWAALRADSQFAPALALSLWVGVASTLLATALSVLLVTALHGTAAWQRLHALLGAALALPHAAFAIGLALLLMPSGLFARLLAPLFGWSAPPDVATVQDGFGIALVVGLVLKEVPFLLWNVAALLQRVGQGAELTRQLQSAGAMGYAPATVWWRVLWPQLLPRLRWPVLAVWAYGLTVVDMALVLGPTSPPTLAVLAWQWLNDADVAMNRQGAAAALVLTLLLVTGAALAAGILRLARPALRAARVRGDRPRAAVAARLAVAAMWFCGSAYAGVLAMLAFVSVAAVWAFPQLWPQEFTGTAWASVLRSGDTLWLTATLALCAAASGVLIAVAWMESAPASWDRRAAPLVFAPMLVPGVLLVVGLYRLALWLGIDGRFVGLWLAHGLYAAPYVLVALAPAYRGFDPRVEQTALALGRSRMAFLWRVKWPMLLAPLAAAFAVGFAVSVAQYLPTQFVGAGRYATVTTEALTLAAGGQRTLTAALALLQTLLPALVFGLAWALGRRQAQRLGAA
jgi:putative thiamine transport system permease protein